MPLTSRAARRASPSHLPLRTNTATPPSPPSTRQPRDLFSRRRRFIRPRFRPHDARPASGRGRMTWLRSTSTSRTTATSTTTLRGACMCSRRTSSGFVARRRRTLGRERASESRASRSACRATRSSRSHSASTRASASASDSGTRSPTRCRWGSTSMEPGSTWSEASRPRPTATRTPTRRRTAPSRTSGWCPSSSPRGRTTSTASGTSASRPATASLAR